MTDTESTTPAYVTKPEPPSIYLGNDARIYARHGTSRSVVGPDYISVNLYGVRGDLSHVDVGGLTMTPAAAKALHRKLGEALADRSSAAEQVSA